MEERHKVTPGCILLRHYGRIHTNEEDINDSAERILQHCFTPSSNDRKNSLPRRYTGDTHGSACTDLSYIDKYMKYI